jgi:hypothetical protein
MASATSARVSAPTACDPSSSLVLLRISASPFSALARAVVRAAASGRASSAASHCSPSAMVPR